MSSGERILFLDNSFKMCHCLSMSVMDKKVMQNEMTIFFNGFTLSPHTHTRESCSNMKNCCSSTFKTLYHTLMTISSWNRWNICCPFLLWPSFVRIPWLSHSEPSLSTFNSQVLKKTSKAGVLRSMRHLIYGYILDSWERQGVEKKGRGVWERKKSK